MDTNSRDQLLMKNNWTDAKLLEALRGGAKTRDLALEEFFYTDPGPLMWVVQFVVQRGGSREDAEEVFQDAVIAFDQNVQRQSFEGRSKVMSYFYEIAKHNWFKRFRSLRPEPPVMYHEFGLSEPPPEIDQGEEGRMQIYDYGWENLSARCRQLLTAKYHEGMSMKEIANEYGVSSDKMAKRYVDRCRDYMLKRMKKHPLYPRVFKSDQ